MKHETRLAKVVSYTAILIAFAVAGGALGYLYQGGVLDYYFYLTGEDTFGSLRRREKAMEPVSRETHQKRLRLGWWVGLAAGTGLGIAFLVRETC